MVERPNLGLCDTLLGIFGFHRVEPGNPGYVPIYKIDDAFVITYQKKKEKEDDQKIEG